MLGREYNLNNIKEKKVTKDFLTLDKNIIQCQNEESYNDCTTRKYVDDLLKYCGCLPFQMAIRKKVGRWYEAIIGSAPYPELLILR